MRWRCECGAFGDGDGGERRRLGARQRVRGGRLPPGPGGALPSSAGRLAAPGGWRVRRAAGAGRAAGAPAQGEIEANPAARTLPTSWAELAEWKATDGFIQAGVATYASMHGNALGDIVGLARRTGSRPFRGGDVPALRDPAPAPGARDSVEEKGCDGHMAALIRLLPKKGDAWPDVLARHVENVDTMAVRDSGCRLSGQPRAAGGDGRGGYRRDRVLREGHVVSL